ncbi:regulatory protein RecX [Prolixibacter denitrificans]|uniref:Regulatory protein RecX n=1 Tax=Prolixibacter denitrificans TaxID=1541063 RepID=A0A2P8CKX0_9BACT|nr:regulatory protein RecX [Prolixibacter denitrificans]PSK85620.1 regulatory protein [Prolixibacter denitrificans]GET20240.1 regulatory protein RecX [Prolixibacter denitrificans]
MNPILNYKDALNKAAALCSKSEKCSGDIRKKLLDWGLSPEDANKAIAWLQEEKFLDDERFAGFFARDKFRFNGWGRIKIRYTLRQKDVASSIIDKAVAAIDENDYRRFLKELIQAKAGKTKAESTYEKKAKLVRYAQGRGFEPELIFNAVDDVLAGEE